MIGIIIFTMIALILGTLLVLTDNHFNKETDKIEEYLPGYNCGTCGFGSCSGMREAILENSENYKKCRFIKEQKAIKYFESLNKGFTLIELLAVIIIIGLIAVITIPKINDMVEDSKRKIAETSALGYSKAVDEYLLNEESKKNIITLNGDYNINSDGKLHNFIDFYDIKVTGKKPNNGVLTYINNELKSACITVNKYKITIINEEITNVEKGTCEYTSVEDNITTIATNYAKNVEPKKQGITGVFDLPIADVSNEKIDSGWVCIENGTVTSFSLKIESFVATLANKNITVTNTTQLANKSETIPSSALFALDSWSEIKSKLTSNRNTYPIGSEKEVIIDGISYTVRLSNTSSCPNGWPETASKTTCGVVIEFVDTIIDTENNNTDGHVMNSTSTTVGGWPASSMRTFLSETLFNKLPSELKENGMIQNTYVVSSHGETEGETNFVSTDKLYLLSYVEVNGTNHEEVSLKLQEEGITDGTRQLEYYSTSKATKKKKKTTGAETTWWLRSAYMWRATNFAIVLNDGTLGFYPARTVAGIAPAFRILD